MWWRLDPALRAANWFGLAGWVVLAWHLVVLVNPHFHPPPRPNAWNDALVYMESATRAVAHPGHLYDAAIRQLGRPRAQRAFIYPPGALLPFLPLVPVAAAGGNWLGAAVWAVLDAIALYSALTWIGRRAGLSWAILGALLSLSSFSRPVAWELGSGQVNGLVLLLIAAALARVGSARAGLGLGLALVVKPIAPVILVVPALRRQFGSLLLALACFVLVNAVFVPVIGVHAALAYLTQILPFLSHYVIHDRSNVGLPNVLQTWLGSGPLPRGAAFAHPVPDRPLAIATLWLLRAAIALVALACAVRQRVSTERALVLVLATVPALAATVWPHYFVLTLPLALVLFTSGRAGAVIATAGLVLMLVIGPLPELWLSWLVLWPGAAFVWMRVAERQAPSTREPRPGRRTAQLPSGAE
jgi:hypothetical protein